MIGYLKLLSSLGPKDSLIPSTGNVAVLLSGQSDFRHSELRQDQRDILEYLKNKGYLIVNSGFPFNIKHNYFNCKRAGMIGATVRNILQYVLSIFSPNYRKIIAKHLQPIFTKRKRVIIVCQSAGLNMFKTTLPYLSIEKDIDVRLLALGPVVHGTFTDKRFKLLTVKGSYDWISRLFDRQKVDIWVNCNHFGYFVHKEIYQIVDKVLGNGD